MAPRKPKTEEAPPPPPPAPPVDGLLWKVVGGADFGGGIIVRHAADTRSPEMPERLSTGALVKELKKEGVRLHYERLSGTGPSSGWVSVQLPSGKDLLVRYDGPAPAATGGGSSSSTATAPPPPPPAPSPTKPLDAAASTPAARKADDRQKCSECGSLSAQGASGPADSPHAGQWYCAACWDRWGKSEASATPASPEKAASPVAAAKPKPQPPAPAPAPAAAPAQQTQTPPPVKPPATATATAAPTPTPTSASASAASAAASTPKPSPSPSPSPSPPPPPKSQPKPTTAPPTPTPPKTAATTTTTPPPATTAPAAAAPPAKPKPAPAPAPAPATAMGAGAGAGADRRCGECRANVGPLGGAEAPKDSEFAGQWFCEACWRQWLGPAEAAEIMKAARAQAQAKATAKATAKAKGAGAGAGAGQPTKAGGLPPPASPPKLGQGGYPASIKAKPLSSVAGLDTSWDPLADPADERRQPLVKAKGPPKAGKAGSKSTAVAGTCGRCMKGISGESVAAGGQHFHPHCFRCKACSQRITDDFSTDRDGFLCKACSLDKSPKCAECGKAIVGESMTAEGKSFHLRCFTCSVCKSLIEQEFFMNGGKRVCATCQNQRLPRCAECGHGIAGEVMSAEGKQFHPECFICQACGKRVKDYFMIQDRRICKPCKDTKLPRCAACREPIAAEFMNAMGKKFHPGCCVGCRHCGARIQGEFFLQDGYPVCQRCTGSGSHLPRCAACGKGINGDSMNAEGRAYHPNCWRCGLCNTLLTQLFVPHEGKHICERCYAAQAPKCHWCKQGVLGEGTSDADGNLYHAECFACSNCGQPIVELYFPVSDHIICKRCYHGKPPTCKGCNSAIRGEYVSADGQPHHRNCFACSRCHKAITGRFLINNGRFTCSNCHGEQRRSTGTRRLGQGQGGSNWATGRLQQLRRELRDLRRAKPQDRKKRLRGLQLELHPDKQPSERRKQAQPLFLLVQEEWEATKLEEQGKKAKRSAEALSEEKEVEVVVEEEGEEDWRHVREAWYGT